MTAIRECNNAYPRRSLPGAFRALAPAVRFLGGNKSGGAALARWLWPAILVGEIIGLALGYSTQSLDSRVEWWARLFRSTRYFIPLSATVLAVMVLWGGRKLYKEIACSIQDVRHWIGALPFFLAHLSVFAAFAFLTHATFSGQIVGGQYSITWALLWVVAGSATFLSWCLIALPPKAWLDLVSRCRSILLTGLTVGAGVWFAGLVAQHFWTSLGKYTFLTVQWMLSPMFPNIVADPNTLALGVPKFMVFVAPECSGYEGIGIVSAMLGFYLWFFRQRLRFPLAMLLLPLGIGAVWLANSLRIAALLTIGILVSPELAVGGFHEHSGWLATIGISLGLIFAAERLNFFRRPASDMSAVSGTDNPTAAYLIPLLAIIATAMITGAFTTGFDWLYPIRVLVGFGVLWFFKKSYAEIQWSWSWHAVAFAAVTAAIWVALGSSGPSERAALPDMLVRLPVGWSAIWIFFGFAQYILVAPIAEELAFRGYLARRLVSADFLNVEYRRLSWISLLVTSAIFGAMHGSNWLPGILAGAVFFWAFRRRGQIGEAVQAHIFTNGLIAIYAVFSGDWSRLS